jgi:hypothetical protein
MLTTAVNSSNADPALHLILSEQRQRVGAALLALLQYVMHNNPEILTQQQQEEEEDESDPMAGVLPAVEQLLAADGYDFLAWQYNPQVGVQGDSFSWHLHTVHGTCTRSWHLHCVS